MVFTAACLNLQTSLVKNIRNSSQIKRPCSRCRSLQPVSRSIIKLNQTSCILLSHETSGQPELSAEYHKLVNKLERRKGTRHKKLLEIIKIYLNPKCKDAQELLQDTHDEKLREILLNISLLRCKDAQEMLQILQKQKQMMNYVNVSTAAVVIARSFLFDPKKHTNLNYEIKSIYATYAILCQLIQQHRRQMDEQEITNSLWSLGKAVDVLGTWKIRQYKPTFKILCSRLMSIINESHIDNIYMTTQNTSNILLAMVKFQWDDRQQIQRVVRQAVTATKKQYLPQNISNILWAMAVLKYEDLKATRHFVELTKSSVRQIDSEEISNLLWALQYQRFYDKKLFLRIENIFINSDMQFNCHSISNLAMAFTDFGLQNKEKILEILVKKFISDNNFTPQNLANFLYALAQLNCPLNLFQEVVENCLTKESKSYKLKNFQDIHLRQIMQTKIFYRVRNLNLLFPQELEQKLENELKTCPKLIYKNSFTDEVLSDVKIYFKFARKNVLICDNQVQVNIALQQGEKNKVAVEISTRKSYFVNQREKLLGRFQHHFYLLQHLGWQVVHFKIFMWKNLEYKHKLQMISKQN